MDSEAASSYASSDAEMADPTDWQQLLLHAEKQAQRKKKKLSTSGHHQVPPSTQQQMVSGASVAPHPHEASPTQPPNNSSAHFPTCTTHYA
ncbi:hypothetical protein R5R35_001700 [Gryllus longicercus]|uniref:Uncharacterized protein n=1 Tax=Gryllus longicercus TaxID=2509291 RepID=A0AAN9V5T8_9ORTH